MRLRRLTRHEAIGKRGRHGDLGRGLRFCRSGPSVSEAVPIGNEAFDVVRTGMRCRAAVTASFRNVDHGWGG